MGYLSHQKRESGFNAPSVSARPKDFDPFLLLDDFRNDNPAIDVWIRLSLKPNRTHAPPARAPSLYSSTESEVVRELLFSLQLALQFPL